MSAIRQKCVGLSQALCGPRAAGMNRPSQGPCGVRVPKRICEITETHASQAKLQGELTGRPLGYVTDSRVTGPGKSLELKQGPDPGNCCCSLSYLTWPLYAHSLCKLSFLLVSVVRGGHKRSPLSSQDDGPSWPDWLAGTSSQSQTL